MTLSSVVLSTFDFDFFGQRKFGRGDGGLWGESGRGGGEGGGGGTISGIYRPPLAV